MEKDKLVTILRNQKVLTEESCKQMYIDYFDINSHGHMGYVYDYLDVVEVAEPKEIDYTECVDIIFKDDRDIMLWNKDKLDFDINDIESEYEDYFDVLGNLINRYETRMIKPNLGKRTVYIKMYHLKEDGTELREHDNGVFERLGL